MCKKAKSIALPIEYKPELTRCTHEASEAVSRVWSRVLLVYVMRVVFCALR